MFDSFPKRKKLGHRGFRTLGVLVMSLMLVTSMLPVSFAAGPYPVQIGFTSDVHGNITNLGNWLTNLKSSAPTLDRMIFGGDYASSDAQSITMATNAKNKVEEIYGTGTAMTFVRGNHDPSNAMFE